MRSKPCKDKQCRRAGQRLRLNQFPRNRNMSDGRFSYCRECSVRRTQEYRARVKEKKGPQVEPPKVQRKAMIKARLKRAFNVCTVYDAISSGCRTRQAIHKATQLSYEAIGLALCELIWDAKAVVILNREFYLRDQVRERRLVA